MILLPPSLKNPKELKDEQGQPWVPTVKESLIYGLVWALITAVILELAGMINYLLVDGSGLEKFGFDFSHLLIFMIYVLACYFIIVLPVLYWRKKQWQKRHEEADSAEVVE